MRGVAVLLALVLFLLLGALLWWLAGRFERASANRPAPEAPWVAASHPAGGRTVVVVERAAPGAEQGKQGSTALESREVGGIDDGDPAYDERLADLMTLARDRARLLNDQAGLR
jgi:predicted lipid-binding transport protein (Tim44 family)